MIIYIVSWKYKKMAVVYQVQILKLQKLQHQSPKHHQNIQQHYLKPLND